MIFQTLPGQGEFRVTQSIFVRFFQQILFRLFFRSTFYCTAQYSTTVDDILT